MKTYRNLAFLVLVAVTFMVHRGELLARDWTPPIWNCPSGCSCTVTETNWLEVTGDCPDVSPADACPYIFQMCEDYCLDLGPYLDIEYPEEGGHSCGFHELLDGCAYPYSLDPPTNTYTCGCYCWVG